MARQGLRALPVLDFLAPGDRPSAVSRRPPAADRALYAAARGSALSRGIGRNARRCALAAARLPHRYATQAATALAAFAVAARPDGGGRYRTPAARIFPRVTGAIVSYGTLDDFA